MIVAGYRLGRFMKKAPREGARRRGDRTGSVKVCLAPVAVVCLSAGRRDHCLPRLFHAICRSRQCDRDRRPHRAMRQVQEQLVPGRSVDRGSRPSPDGVIQYARFGHTFANPACIRRLVGAASCPCRRSGRFRDVCVSCAASHRSAFGGNERATCRAGARSSTAAGRATVRRDARPEGRDAGRPAPRRSTR